MITTQTVLIPGWALPASLFRIRFPDAIVLDTATTDPSDTIRHLRQLGHRVHLIGVSLGGYRGLRWVLQNPEEIHRLTLVGICPGFDHVALDPMRIELDADPVRFLEGFYRQCLFPRRVYRQVEAVLKDALPQMIGSACDTFDALYDYHITAQDLCVAGPRLVHGQHDPVVPLAQIVPLAQSAGISLQIIADSGHIPFFNPGYESETR